MSEPVTTPLSGKASPRLEAALQLAGFPPDSMLVICMPKKEQLPPAHVDACCCVCGADVVRSQISLHLNSMHSRIAVGCAPCVLKAMGDARRMGVA